MSSTEDGPCVVIERRSNSGIGVFLLGAAIGAGLALLYAPESGKKMRGEIAKGAKRLKRRVRDVTDATRDAASDFARGTGDAARDAREALERRLAKHKRPRPDEDDDDDGEDSGV